MSKHKCPIVDGLRDEGGALMDAAANEIERLRKGGYAYRDQMREQTTRAVKAEAEIERLRKDAERYQWLRQHHVSWSTDGLVLIDGGRGFDLDRLIDAAMAETGEPK